MDKVALALKSASQTKELLAGKGVITETASVFNRMYPGQKAIIIADKTTFEVAGNTVRRLLEKSGIKQEECYIFDERDMHAEWKYIERLNKRLSGTDAIPVAVGSGTVNDLVKLSATHAQRPYMTVATAASMDGYTSCGASITKDGAKQTFSCKAPEAVIADLDVIATAPAEMTAGGYADLFAKIPAGADWILADALNIEPVDELAFSIVQDGLHDALGDPAGLRKGDLHALKQLTEGLMLGGFAMQAYPRSSRPASGAEHQFSHLWDMENFVMKNGMAPSHGFKVSIGTLVSIAFYELLLNSDIKNLDIERCVKAWPVLADAESKAIELFKDTGFPAIGLTETRAKYITHQELRQQLTGFRDTWETTQKRLQNQLIPVNEAVERLKTVGAPVTPEQIGISRQKLRDSIIPAQHLRRRFTILDIAVRTDLIDEWMNTLFGKGGLWDIREERIILQ
ncbi:MAG: sn-glycerol-1-phosphate dehydrogenase [Tannerella sp.]|jgi:glycerol-1-phosphate dehydrogenase [NAD(P)+]|nr:sn-glycerol-1-phosphate dehydrogenase [Tannerella sp.]